MWFINFSLLKHDDSDNDIGIMGKKEQNEWIIPEKLYFKTREVLHKILLIFQGFREMNVWFGHFYLICINLGRWFIMNCILMWNVIENNKRIALWNISSMQGYFGCREIYF